jgi:hypothetical protein
VLIISQFKFGIKLVIAYSMPIFNYEENFTIDINFIINICTIHANIIPSHFPDKPATQSSQFPDNCACSLISGNYGAILGTV